MPTYLLSPLTFIVDCFCALVDVRIFLFLPRPPLALAGGGGLSEQGHLWFPSALLWWRIHSCLTRTLLHRLSGETQTRLDIEVCADAEAAKRLRRRAEWRSHLRSHLRPHPVGHTIEVNFEVHSASKRRAYTILCPFIDEMHCNLPQRELLSK